jgi:hypothetical protein
MQSNSIKNTGKKLSMVQPQKNWKYPIDNSSTCLNSLQNPEVTIIDDSYIR